VKLRFELFLCLIYVQNVIQKLPTHLYLVIYIIGIHIW
jgi:hypothetical protein